MGSGRWDASVYASTTKSVIDDGGSGFAYSDTTRSRPSTEWKVEESLDPKIENKAGAHAGMNIREALDTDEHPNSLAIAVLFDVTGSMHSVPRELIKKLPTLLGLLGMKGYVEDPQILFGAIGDATSDRVPLQIGQFESDNRLDEDLSNIFLEGNGGGQNTESYELAMYFMARHTYIDCFEKREKKGYLFIIGDEHPYPAVKSREVRDIIGDDLAENISTVAIVEELKQKWETYFIIPSGTAHYDEPDLLAKWRGLLGQNAVRLPDLSAVAEYIAVTVGIAEETVTLAQAEVDLKDHGTDDNTINSVRSAMSTAGA
jgi:hypothetical protein